MRERTKAEPVVHFQVRMTLPQHAALVACAEHRQIGKFVLDAINEKIEKTGGSRKKIRKALAR